MPMDDTSIVLPEGTGVPALVPPEIYASPGARCGSARRLAMR